MPIAELGPALTEAEVIQPHFSAAEVGQILEFPGRGLDQLAPVLAWPEFYKRFVWQQDQHVGIIGPTDSGKTNLAYSILPKRTYRTVFGFKARDKTLAALISPSPIAKAYGRYKPFPVWRKEGSNVSPRRLLWPREYLGDLGAMISSPGRPSVVTTIFSDAMASIYRDPGWGLFIDDLWFVCNVLRMEQLVKIYLMMARSLPVPLLMASQRPAWIPLEVYDQSTHLLFARDNDEQNLSRISGIAWLSAEDIVRIVANLPMYQFLYLNTRTGYMCRTTPPDVWQKKKG